MRTGRVNLEEFTALVLKSNPAAPEKYGVVRGWFYYCCLCA
jgi:hypothetical protein